MSDASPTEAGERADVFVRLVPTDAACPPPVPAAGAFRRNAFETLRLVGEWIGVTGPQATLVSRLTVAAVALVLVSGMTLVLAPADSARTERSDSDLTAAPDVVVEYEESTAPRVLPPQGQVLSVPNDLLEPEVIAPAAFERPSAPPRRAAWLEGTIEVD